MENEIPLSHNPELVHSTVFNSTKRWFTKKITILLLAILTFLIVVLVYAVGFSNNPTPPSAMEVPNPNRNTILPQTTPKASPIPFYELTIPYLRERSYESSLSALERVQYNGSYTSYLTSYNSDGLKINGLLTQPDSEMPADGWSAIIFIHGYIPPAQYRTLERYVAYVDTLARNGFVVFKIDLRGHGSSEGEPGGAYYSSDYIIDVLNAHAALQSSDFVNPEKIGLWGHSMAGNVSLRAFAAKADIPAAVIWGGAGFTYLDLGTYGISDSSYQPQPSDTQRQRRRQQLRQLYGDPKDGDPFWNQVSPVNYFHDVKGAIALHHATDDKTVSVEYSRNLKTILETTAIPHEYHEYPTGGHDIEGASFSLAMQRTVDFYKKYLNVE